MISLYIFRFFFISHLWLLLTSTATVNGHHRLCPPSFECGYLGTLYFPFTNTKRPDCGLVAIHGCEEHDPRAAKTIQVNNEPRSFRVTKIEQFPWMIYIKDDDLQEHLNSHNCEAFRNNITLPSSSPLGSFQVDNLKTITLFRCNRNLSVETPPGFNNYSCLDYVILYDPSIDIEIPSSLHACSSIQLPVRVSDSQDLFTHIDYEIPVQVRLSPRCLQCYYRLGGQCLLDNQGNFRCVKDNKSWILKLGLGIGLGTAITCTAGLIILRFYKRKNDPSDIQFTSRNTNADRNSNTDPESGSFNFGVPLFSYKELEEATNNFNHSRELGDGGFGTVYYGKLRDGRDVAIKRLYEHNYRRVEQFMNEVDMLTRLRHRNLVSLYGCTSRKSQELLLVYEYIPNGTLASHLHGDFAELGLLSWPTRMKIAIETASALAYLHASNIIHRDVKTNNILLDNGYWVKVADFGLSRSFPNDVTHVSTTPQGTPGYVDPEYHQCHQLTSKSDVYSFGVVLIELISSMPPVDLTRHKNEINLANFAMKKILKGAFSELVDPVLGFESDNDVKRMVVSVAELAFRCLQGDREFRPSMDEILEALRRIESGRDEPEIVDEEYVSGAGNSHNYLLSPTLTSPDWDEVRLLMNRKPSSSSRTCPNKWESDQFTVSNVNV